MPLNDDPDALPDAEYLRLITEAQRTAEPCCDAVPPTILEAALARLDQAGVIGGAGIRGD